MLIINHLNKNVWFLHFGCRHLSILATVKLEVSSVILIEVSQSTGSTVIQNDFMFASLTLVIFLFNISDPSSMQVVCHMNLLNDQARHKSSIAPWLRKVTGSTPVEERGFFSLKSRILEKN